MSTESTVLRKFWLWFRFVLMGFGISACIGAVAGVCWIIGDLMDAGHYVAGTAVIAVIASVVIGSIIYAAHRSENPYDYR